MTVPSERSWEIERQIDPATNLPLPIETPEIAQQLVELAPILARIGGVLSIGAVREQIGQTEGGEKVYGTTHVRFVWQSFAWTPPRIETPPEPEPEEELAEAPDEEPVGAAAP